ncbi:MAG: uroporphyrinogen decarboxylase family protein [Candidatus Thorarchaeota archaeon]
MIEKMSALERIQTVLEGGIPDRIPSFCLGGDFDFVDKFMKSPYALTDDDMKQLDKDKISYRIPYIHAIIAKFSPHDILPGGLDAKIDLCWQNPNMPLPIKLDTLNDFVMYNGGNFKIVVRDEGIPHWWYAGPALLKKENIEEYWSKENDLKPDESSVRSFAKIRKTMLKKYDIVVAQGQPGPFENCVFGIGHANFARLARKDPSYLKQLIEFQWETFEEPMLKMIMRTKPDMVMCGDDYGFNDGLQLPPRLWRKFIKPILAEYVKYAHDGGAKFLIHSCGAIEEIFRDFVEICIDGVESLKPKNNDLKMYREKYPEISLIGTIDDSEMLIYESPEFIRNSVKKSIKTLGKKGGYIPGPTNFLLDQPPENIVACYKAIQEFGKY